MKGHAAGQSPRAYGSGRGFRGESLCVQAPVLGHGEIGVGESSADEGSFAAEIEAAHGSESSPPPSSACRGVGLAVHLPSAPLTSALRKGSKPMVEGSERHKRSWMHIQEFVKNHLVGARGFSDTPAPPLFSGIEVYQGREEARAVLGAQTEGWYCLSRLCIRFMAF